MSTEYKRLLAIRKKIEGWISDDPVGLAERGLCIGLDSVIALIDEELEKMRNTR